MRSPIEEYVYKTVFPLIRKAVDTPQKKVLVSGVTLALLYGVKKGMEIGQNTAFYK